MASLKLAESGADLIDDALHTVRNHFGMPVAYLSRFDGDTLVYRNVSAPGLEDLIKAGDVWDAKDVYCSLIRSGDLPYLIPDTSSEPLCQSLAVTSAAPIGSHISLPVHMQDGSVYGMFCCLSPVPNPTLNERDVSVMANFASLVARQVQLEETAYREDARRHDWAVDLIAQKRFHSVFQPLVRLKDGQLAGVEALTRFDASVGLSTEDVFSTVAEAGLGRDIELATLASALDAAAGLPNDVYLSVNASPGLICDTRFDDILRTARTEDLVVEITEHSLPEDETELSRHVDRLRGKGHRVAIDDVGAGYSGLQRIAQLLPDILKLDRSIVAGIDQSLPQRAVVAALVHFAGETRADVLAEGVETEAEASTLRALGVKLAQGWLFGRPAPLNQ